MVKWCIIEVVIPVSVALYLASIDEAVLAFSIWGCREQWWYLSPFQGEMPWAPAWKPHMSWCLGFSCLRPIVHSFITRAALHTLQIPALKAAWEVSRSLLSFPSFSLILVRCHPDCLTCSRSPDHCDLCQDPTRLLQNGRCVHSCGLGFYQAGSLCLGMAPGGTPQGWYRKVIGTIHQRLFL